MVLESRCVSHPPHEPGYGLTRIEVALDGSLEDESLLVPSVTCFADIPAPSLGPHVEKYGHFGLSFRRDFLIRHGARPVMYIPMVPGRWPFGPPTNGRGLLDDIAAVYRGLDAFVDGRIGDQAKSSRSLGVVPTTEQDVLLSVKSTFELSLLAFLKPFDATLPVEHRNCFYMEREWRKLGNLPFTFNDVTRVWVANGFASEVEGRFPMLAGRVEECPRPM